MRSDKRMTGPRRVAAVILVAVISTSQHKAVAATHGAPDRAGLQVQWQGFFRSPADVEFQIIGQQPPRIVISRSIALAELAGIDRAELLGPSRQLQFRYTAEAGQLACTGTVGAGQGAGTCRFFPSVPYAAALARLGVPVRDALQQLRLGMARVTSSYAAQMLGAGLRDADAEDLKRLRNHGIGPQVVSAAADKTAAGLIHTEKRKYRWSREAIR